MSLLNCSELPFAEIVPIAPLAPTRPMLVVLKQALSLSGHV